MELDKDIARWSNTDKYPLEDDILKLGQDGHRRTRGMVHWSASKPQTE